MYEMMSRQQVVRLIEKHAEWHTASPATCPTLLTFINSATVFDNCVMVDWLGMTLGIELDGYAHT
jgi:hypothetical protein